MKAMSDPTIWSALESYLLAKNSGIVLASSFWVMTRVLRPRTSHARRLPMKALPRPTHVEDRPYFQPNWPA